MRSTLLFWRIFGMLAVLYFAIALAFVVVIANRERAQVSESIRKNLFDIATVVHRQLTVMEPTSRPDWLQRLVAELGQDTNSRITLIDRDGRVLADSDYDAASMENHADRPEIVQARRVGVGSSERFSETLQERMLYVCVSQLPNRSSDGTAAEPERRSLLETSGPTGGAASATSTLGSDLLVRVAVSTSVINARIAEVQRFIWAFALLLAAIASSATWFFASRTVQPLRRITDAANQIARGDYQTRVQVDRRHPAWGMLSHAFESMQLELQSRENELKENASRLETVLGSMSEGVLAINEENRLLFMNRAARGLLMVQQGDPAGRNLLELARYPEIEEALEKAWQSTHPVRCEFETRGPHRRQVTMRMSSISVGDSRGLVAVMHDVTEIRQLETMRRDFVANVSHELKTPLSSIKAYAETLRMGAIHDQARNIEFVEQIEFQADRLHQLILDLIHLARVESGQTVFEITAVSVAKVLDETAVIFGPLATSREIDFRLEPDESLQVMADAEGLRAILDNLVSNALRYTQPGGTVRVRCGREDDQGVIEIEDTGIGIAAEHQQRIFERFYRVDKARSSDLGGTGLGLSIVKHLTNAFDGTVSLQSKVGRGSLFRVSLPLA